MAASDCRHSNCILADILMDHADDSLVLLMEQFDVAEINAIDTDGFIIAIGDLDVVVDVRNNVDFASLPDDITMLCFRYLGTGSQKLKGRLI